MVCWRQQWSQQRKWRQLLATNKLYVWQYVHYTVPNNDMSENDANYTKLRINTKYCQRTAIVASRIFSYNLGPV